MVHLCPAWDPHTTTSIRGKQWEWRLDGSCASGKIWVNTNTKFLHAGKQYEMSESYWFLNSNKKSYQKNILFFYFTARKLSGRQNRSMVYTSKVLNGRRWCWQRKLSKRRMSKYKSTKKYSKTWVRGHCIYSFSWECQGNNFEPMQYGLNIVYIYIGYNMNDKYG